MEKRILSRNTFVVIVVGHLAMSASRHAACVSLPISYDVKQLEPKLRKPLRTTRARSEVAAYMGRPLPRQHPFFALLQIVD
jgi:hypothetical protein